jgi:hypothetical protein
MKGLALDLRQGAKLRQTAASCIKRRRLKALAVRKAGRRQYKECKTAHGQERARNVLS